MKYPIYIYRDSKANSFSPPIVEYNEPCAVRTFEQRCHDANTSMGFSPGDFDLFQCGEFDSDTGEVKGMMLKFVVNGASVV